jgi:hypothetical protein
MSISVIDAVSGAFERTRRMLFEPFDIGKWFVLGFCAWLANLGESGGGGGGFNYGTRTPMRPGAGRSDGFPLPPEIQAAIDWGEEHLFFVIAAAVALFVLLVAIWVVLTWLSSRGKFMFLDGVVKNRGAIVEPWRQFRTVANSLFWFRILVGAISLVLSLAIAALGVVIAWEDIQARQFGERAIIGLVTSGLLLVLWGFAAVLIALLLKDFVVPVMYLRGARTWAAWGIFGREILCGHVGAIIVFYLLKIVLAIGIAIIACLAMCFTCCIAALPYIGTVILLPVFVFERCYSLYFVQQVSPVWRLFQDEPPPYVPAASPPAA